MRADRKWEQAYINENNMETIVESLILVPKYFFSFLFVPIANGSKINVWIQGTKVGDDCFFHDGVQMPTDLNEFCPLILTSIVDEIHLRADGSTTFSCVDMIPIAGYTFLCEQYSRFTIYLKKVWNKNMTRLV